jgi:glutamyl-tRNA synthetase
MADGRFAPSPTGPLHLGNLRTALLAWLFARAEGSRFSVRIEDLDVAAARPEHEESALADLAALGLDHDGPIVRQSERRTAHDGAIAALVAAGRTYPCYCTRREVLAESEAAARAPQGRAPGAYPGTCRDLDAAGRRAREDEGRRPSLRVRAHGEEVGVDDRVVGRVQRTVDDFVVRRADGTPAYNLAVVVDDAALGVEEVVRGDDLVETTPRQVLLGRWLGLPIPAFAHVPLVLGPDGERLAKRHGAVTLADQRSVGRTPGDVLGLLAGSLGLAEAGESVTARELVGRFDVDRVPRRPWVLPEGVAMVGGPAVSDGEPSARPGPEGTA